MADTAQQLTGQGSRFDAIAMEVFTNRMLSITETMANHMMRSSFSTQIKERLDFSVGIFDETGRVIAQGMHMPMHLGSLMGAMEALLARYDTRDIAEGDAFICNDAYLAGGTHQPDIAIITPIFLDGRIVAYAANIGHHTDVGGSVPGSISAEAGSIFEEGLRIPIIRLARAGVVDEDLLRMISENSRLPEERTLDLRVQIAVNSRGGDEMRTLFRRMGLDEAKTAIDNVCAYTGERIRKRLEDMKPGKYSFKTWLDDDGTGGDPVPIVATVTIGGNGLHIDFEGTGPQAKGAYNVPLNALRASVYYCVKAMVDPDLMANSGLYDAVTISAPKGSIVNPNFPGAVGARSTTCNKVAGAIFGAFREVLEQNRLIASSHDLIPSFNFSGTRADGTYWIYGETMGGGVGARIDTDGMNAVHVHVSNSSNMPVEALENEFPLLCEEYGTVVDSGGAGRQRGGLGIVRQVRALRDDTVFSARMDTYIHGAEGIDGGGTGGLSKLIQNPGRSDEKRLPPKIRTMTLSAGESVRIETPGGGGFGAPHDRPLDAIMRDLRDGVVTKDEAERNYGADHVRAALRDAAATEAA
jgi:N-methylhydantoinase B